MKRWLRQLLGVQDMIDAMQRLEKDIVQIRSDLTVTYFDEHHPSRKAASDRLGEMVIKRLIAEDKARKHTTGEL